MNIKKSSMKSLNIIAISLLFFYCGSGGIVNSTLQASIEAWPDVAVSTIRLASTLPSLISLPVMFIASKYIHKIGYKPCMVLGILTMSIGGIAPVIYAPSWNVVLLYRVIVGIGAGFVGLRTAYLLKSFEVKDHSKVVGLTNAMNSLASVVLTPVAGILTAYNWNTPYALFAFGFIVLLIAVLGIKDVDSVEEIVEESVAHEKLDYRIWVYFVLIFVESVILYPVLSGMSTFVILKGIGSAALAGTLIAFHNVGGFFAGFMIDKMEKVFGKASVSIGFGFILAGQALDLYVPNAIVIAIGTAFTGVGYFLVYSMITVYTGRISTHRNLALGSSLLLISMQLGIFLSVYYMSGVHAVFQMENDVVSSWFATILISMITIIVTFVLRNRLFPDAK